MTNHNFDLPNIISGVRVIASRLLHKNCLLIGELAIRRTLLYLEAMFLYVDNTFLRSSMRISLFLTR